MIKEEPNPEFFKDFGSSKFQESIGQSIDNLESSEFKSVQTKLFDFGISDEDWGNGKQIEPKQKPLNLQENQGFDKTSKQNDFETFNMESPKKQTIQQKKQKLKEMYLLSKKKGSNKQKEESQLEQIIKFNNQAQSASKLVSSSSRVQTDDTQDFFSLAQQQDNEEGEFSVFDNPSILSASSKRYSSSPAQSYGQIQQSPKDAIEHFQTQSLLENQQGQQKTQQKVFSLKHLESSLCLVKIGIHLVSITVISVMYGFLNSLILLILHDFSQFLFVIIQLLLKNKFQAHKSSTDAIQEGKKVLSMSDEIEQVQTLPNKLKKTPSYFKYERNIKRLISFHLFFKYSLYLSSISFVGFIIVHITQIDTFFSTNYFSFMNWGSIIALVIILIMEGVWNVKMVRRIDEILFYENSVLEDVKVLNQKSRANHERGIYEESL